MTFENKTKYEQARENLIERMLAKIDEDISQTRQENLHPDGQGFNEFIYRQFTPVLIVASNSFRDSFTDPQSFIKQLINTLDAEFNLPKETILSMKPYVTNFLYQVTEGILIANEIPAHLSPMKSDSFRRLAPPEQLKHRRIEIEIAKEIIQTIIKRNRHYLFTN